MTPLTGNEEIEVEENQTAQARLETSLQAAGLENLPLAALPADPGQPGCHPERTLSSLNARLVSLR